MKLALVTHLIGDYGGGVTKVVDELFEHFDSKFDIKIFGLNEVGRSFSFSRGFVDGRLGIDLNIERSILEFNPDLIHLHGMFTFVSLSALRAAIKISAPLIVSPHGMLDPWALKNSRLKKSVFMAIVENKVLRYASKHHALNEFEADSIVAVTSSPEKIVCVPNGIDLPEITRDASLDANLKKILFLGRLHPKKGLSELFLGLNIVLNNAPHLRYQMQIDIVGWGDLSHVDYFKKQVDDLGLRDIVKFRGAAFGSSKADYLSSAHAFILPSFSEGLPMAVLEAWSYGLPVIMTRQCNLPIGFECNAAIEVTTHPQSIASVLLALCQCSLNDLQAIGARGKSLVRDRFAWDVVTAKYVAMYSEVMEQHASS